MSADLDVVESRRLAAVPVEMTATLATHTAPDPTGGRLVAWAEAARAAAGIGTALSRTSFVPKAFQGKPEECAAALLLGDELGLSPLAALRSIYVISGTPALYARTMVAVVQSHGHEVVPVKETPTEVVVKGRRAGSDEWVQSSWTTDRARRAGYTANKKYETDPQAMLYARAASDVCRRIAADALLGIPYTVEEIELEAPAPTRRVSRTTAMQREPVEGPALDEPTDVEPEPEPEAVEVIPMATAGQVQKLAILLGEHGIEAREDRLAFISDHVHRPIASSKDLNRAEASALIGELTGGAE